MTIYLPRSALIQPRTSLGKSDVSGASSLRALPSLVRREADRAESEKRLRDRLHELQVPKRLA